MYPNIDNDRDIAVVTNVLETRAYKSQSTHCIIAGLEICLKYNNSRFGSQNLLQLNGTVTGAPNSCSYVDLAIFDIDKSVLQTKRNTFQEMRYFGRYRDDCLALLTGLLEKKAYLIGRGYELKNVEKSFNDALNMSRQQSCIKKMKNTNRKNKVVICSKYNPLGPNIKSIIQKHAHILDNCQIMQNKKIMVAYI